MPQYSGLGESRSDEGSCLQVRAERGLPLRGSFTLATLTTAAPGIAGALGFTTTTVVTVPIAAPVILGAGLVLGGQMACMHLKDNKQ